MDSIKSLAIGIEKKIGKWPDIPKDIPQEIKDLAHTDITFHGDMRLYVKFNPNDPKDFRRYMKRMRKIARWQHNAVEQELDNMDDEEGE
jgi:hypothetical protein